MLGDWTQAWKATRHNDKLFVILLILLLMQRW